MTIETEDRYLSTPYGEVFTRRWRVNTGRVPIVLLHDSLGSVELWRDFPERLATASARDVIAYDRLGFGRSAEHPGGWSTRFIEEEAARYFPLVGQGLDVERFIVFGHSVGGAMAACVASQFPDRCQALITESTQAFVEDRTLQGIRQAQAAFAEPGQLDRLRRYHGDKAEWVLSAWIDTWLSEAHADWTLADSAPVVACPLLVLHGQDDEYGTVAHPQRIVEQAAGPAQMVLFEGCRHLPHREQPDAVIDAVVTFLQAVRC
ncbi:alpha/beta fold hydrolase [Stutzerimonas stutzeri]|uniref:alpha/beta fold hydrolase n=1 Tax=Stutzerimonas stutzeri TaxID=316 RepID=UPI001C2ED13A